MVKTQTKQERNVEEQIREKTARAQMIHPSLETFFV